MNEKKTIKWRGLTLRRRGFRYVATLGRRGDVVACQDFDAAPFSARVSVDDPYANGRGTAKTPEAALDLALKRAVARTEKLKQKLNDNLKLLKRLERSKP